LNPEPPATAEQSRPTLAERLTALLEVLICSGYPTQLALAASIAAAGYGPQGADGQLSVTYVVALSLLDTLLVLGLVAMFARSHGDDLRDLFLGRRPPGREAAAGLALVVVAIVLAVAVLLSIRIFLPWLRTVAENPLQDLLRTPRDAALFAIVVVVAGGVREELQRAFLLNRFERWLGGGTVGIVVTSAAFGAGHLLQGADAAIATGLLGALWAVIYLRRRSVIAPVVSHSGFNLLQLAQFLVIAR
jgi:membrane protease YdiL (CAAX protease family)